MIHPTNMTNYANSFRMSCRYFSSPVSYSYIVFLHHDNRLIEIKSKQLISYVNDQTQYHVQVSTEHKLIEQVKYRNKLKRITRS